MQNCKINLKKIKLKLYYKMLRYILKGLIVINYFCKIIILYKKINLESKDNKSIFYQIKIFI